MPVSSSFTTLTEAGVLMIHCLSSSCFKWANSKTRYLANGRWLPGPKNLFEEKAIPVVELPLLGFIGDPDESERANATIVRSTLRSEPVRFEHGSDRLLFVSRYSPENSARPSPGVESGRLVLVPKDIVRWPYPDILECTTQTSLLLSRVSL